MWHVIMAAAVYSCGFQLPGDTACLDHYGKVVTVTAAHRQFAADQAAICALPPEAPIKADDPGLAVFLRDDRTRADAEFRLAYERVNSCDPLPRPSAK